MFLTYETYCEKIKKLNENYWLNSKDTRWKYIHYVIELAKSLKISSICEAGANGIPLNNTSYLLTYPEHDLNNLDLSKFKEKFDLFIALQVWEHLENQQKAFENVCEISKKIILSFPYKWKTGDEQHKKIDDEKIAEWTCNLKPTSTKEILCGKLIRKVYYWDLNEKRKNKT